MTDDAGLPETPTTTLDTDVYAALYAAYETQDYAKILGPEVVAMLADDADRDATLQELALAVLGEYYKNVEQG